MTNRKANLSERLRVMLGVAFAAASISLVPAVGCGEEEPPPPPPPPPRDPGPPPFAWSDVAGLDYRVSFSSTATPEDRELGEQIARFASAFATGDAQTVRAMVDAEAARVLELLQESGKWEAQTGAIEALRVVTFTSEGDVSRFAFAFTVPAGTSVLAWSAQAGEDESWTFSNYPIEQPEPAETLEGYDGMQLRPRMLR